MSSNLDLSRINNWRQVILEWPIDPYFAAALPEYLKAVARSFSESAPSQPSAAEHLQLNAWYDSAEGQECLAAFTHTLWHQMTPLSEHAMPAHDARHAMFKVPAASLEYVAAEGVFGWERVGVLGALLHDYGRWGEERLYNFPASSVLHARISFLLGRELLDAFDMPALIKQHILLAALGHTTGCGPDAPMPYKLTVTADREQLHGPEIVLRLSHHIVGARGECGSFYGENGAISILDRIETFLTNRVPGPLFARDEHISLLWRILAGFVMLAEDRIASEVRFARIFNSKLISTYAHGFVWAQAYDAVHETAEPYSAETALSELLSAAHVAPSAAYRKQAKDKLVWLSAENSSRLGAALHFANMCRCLLDVGQHQRLADIRRDNRDDRLIGTLASLLLENPA